MSDQQRPDNSSVRGLLPRASNPSRLTTPRTSQIPTSRRTSRARADTEKTPTKSSVPTPRRQSKPAETVNDPTRRLSRTPVKSPAARLSLTRSTPSKAPATPSRATTIPSSISTPRRTSNTPTASAEKTPRSRAGVSYRRLSTTSGEPQKPVTPKYRSRLSSSNGADKSRALPDRSTPSLIPSPAARRTSAAGGASQRPALQASPYARRTSGAGAARRASGIGAAGRTAGAGSASRTSYGASGRTSGVGATGRTSSIGSGTKRLSGAAAGARRTTGIPTGKVATGVSRKLNMAPGAEGDENPAKRRVSGVSGAMRKTNRARESGMQSRLDRMEKERAVADVPRRESSGRRAGGPSALESFRAVRRASIESSEGTGKEAVAPMQIDMHAEQATEEKKDGEAEMENVTNQGQESDEKGMEVEKQPRAPQPLPDRVDPVTPTNKLSFLRTPSKTRRTSDRFGDVNINLDNVERLRKSLGRRRSKGPHEDLSKIETPKLRKIGSYSQPPTLDLANRENAGNEQAASTQTTGDQVIADSQGAGNSQDREPLRSIEINTDIEGRMDVADASGNETEKGTSKSKGTPPVPQLDDDGAWENEDVEDLGPF